MYKLSISLRTASRLHRATSASNGHSANMLLRLNERCSNCNVCWRFCVALVFVKMLIKIRVHRSSFCIPSEVVLVPSFCSLRCSQFFQSELYGQIGGSLKTSTQVFCTPCLNIPCSIAERDKVPLQICMFSAPGDISVR